MPASALSAQDIIAKVASLSEKHVLKRMPAQDIADFAQAAVNVYDGRNISGRKRKPLSVLPLIGKGSVPIGFNPRRIICSDCLDPLCEVHPKPRGLANSRFFSNKYFPGGLPSFSVASRRISLRMFSRRFMARDYTFRGIIPGTYARLAASCSPFRSSLAACRKGSGRVLVTRSDL